MPNRDAVAHASRQCRFGLWMPACTPAGELGLCAAPYPWCYCNNFCVVLAWSSSATVWSSTSSWPVLWLVWGSFPSWCSCLALCIKLWLAHLPCLCHDDATGGDRYLPHADGWLSFCGGSGWVGGQCGHCYAGTIGHGRGRQPMWHWKKWDGKRTHCPWSNHQGLVPFIEHSHKAAVPVVCSWLTMSWNNLDPLAKKLIRSFLDEKSNDTMNTLLVVRWCCFHGTVPWTKIYGTKQYVWSQIQTTIKWHCAHMFMCGIHMCAFMILFRDMYW